MATIYIDNKPYDADPSRNLLDVCLSLGFRLPYFCWHPAMGSVGACRQCAVKQFKDEQDTKGKLVMACMTLASEGTRISIDDPDAVEFRRNIIQGLMMNHPHDCPVCDEGGECHLQDMTLMTGHDYRRYRFDKRTFRNQYLGPFVNHEMNRCIQCYRCVRFYRDYAGGRDLDCYALRDIVYFGRREDGVLESEFSGNLVEVCPTGVFTDATLKQHYTRKWDLEFAPSICVHCSLGCNTSPGARYGMLRRIVNRYHSGINRYFLCDRGRYGYEFVNSPLRIRELTWQGRVIDRAAGVERLGELLAAGKAIGIGSPRASLEANFLLREAVGAAKFFAGMADDELSLVRRILEIMESGAAGVPSLHDVELSDAVFVVGEDVSNTAPRMALSLLQSVRQQPIRDIERLRIPLWNDNAVRDAVQSAKGPLYIASPYPTRLDGIATEVYRAAPDDIARLAFEVAEAGDESSPAGRIAAALRNAQRPLVISGTGLNNPAIVEAAARAAQALGAALSYVLPEANSAGLAMMGGGTLAEAIEAVRGGAAETVIVLENDLYRRAPAKAVDALFRSAKNVVALDHLANGTTARADLVLPAATFAESAGTFVNNEGRAQRFFQVFIPRGEIQESRRWLRDAMLAARRSEAEALDTLDGVIGALGDAFPRFARVREAAPPATYRLVGKKIPRDPHRYSGRTAMLANITVSEPKPPDDPDSALAFSMEGYSGQPPPPLIPFFWAPGWNSIQALNRFQEEIAGPLRGGESGVRLLVPNGAAQQQAGAPPAFQARKGERLLVPVYHVFGSEELSREAPAVASLAPGPYLALSPEDAKALGEDTAEVSIGGKTHRLPVRVVAGLPAGVGGVPAGIPPFTGLSLPVWGKFSGMP
ncbi:MAG: NADH-quinone oxidoreductase subunit NuoG [Rhodospirillales bacterium]